jgi:hypothetical protein
MLKKALFISSVASALIAGQYATLKDGRTIIMHENGTWEEVSAVKSSDGQVAAMVARDIAGSPKALSVEEPLARMLMGKWESRDKTLSYEFRNDGTATYTIGKETKTENYSIQFLDAKDNTISVSLGDASRYGKVVFGGLLRKFQLSKDGKDMLDYSDEVTNLKTVNLKKVGNASEGVKSETPKKDVAPKKSEIPATNGFVK